MVSWVAFITMFAFLCAPDGVQTEPIVPFPLAFDQIDGIAVTDVAGDCSVIEQRQWRRRSWHPRSVCKRGISALSSACCHASEVVHVHTTFLQRCSCVVLLAHLCHCRVHVDLLSRDFLVLASPTRFIIESRDSHPRPLSLEIILKRLTKKKDVKSPPKFSEGMIMWCKLIYMSKRCLSPVSICNWF